MLPEIYTFFITFLVIIAIILSLSVLSNQYSKQTDSMRYDTIKKWSIFGALLALFILIVGLFAPLIFSGNLHIGNFTKDDADNASTFNGFIAPFVAIAAVITTGLAFFMQYQANEKLKEQIDKQDKQYQLDKFESQFYEMLRLHRENVNEMEIHGYEYLFTEEQVKLGKSKQFKKVKETRITSGRKVFVTMVTEIEALFLVIKKVYVNENKNLFNDKIPENEMISEKAVDDLKKVFKNEEVRIKYFTLTYDIFFKGYDNYVASIPTLGSEFSDNYLEALRKELFKLRWKHKKGDLSINEDDPKKKKNYLFESIGVINQRMCQSPIVDLKLYFNYKPFSGHQSRLGHYYRHMFNLVKHVVKQSNELLSYAEKRRYLKVFRAQLSNHEIVILYYNWLGGYGKAWEDTDRLKRKRYFTDYKLLHNLEKSLVMPDFDPIVEFGQEKYTGFVYKGNNPDKDTMFVNSDIKSTLSPEENEKIKKSYGVW
ncbi:putative phage abortive infection protein [Sphingobacterium faecium]|uniref:putative phage abortive infection protein n=1 Tax=Sphingobacterium faecium TaxID=34087 RepID=UPI00247AAEE4|nr:putative phage abortive infection protein [Sphingobacterium faecium]WGQ15037.1 putative phage abortive infection protein [Sphingobacterium faecium]